MQETYGYEPEAQCVYRPEASNFGNDLTSQVGEFETAPVSNNSGVSLKANFLK